jgi:hypothetical protein
MLDVLHEADESGGHIFFRSKRFQAFVIRTNQNTGTFDNMPPVIKRILSSQHFTLLSCVARFSLRQLFRFVGNRMQTPFTVFFVKVLLDNGPNGELSRVRVDDEELAELGVS